MEFPPEHLLQGRDDAIAEIGFRCFVARPAQMRI
jgi:hypothetical protein